ncbi:MAG: hypothetical protein ACR2P4_07075 [Gammaproteobacteria bacterium]
MKFDIHLPFFPQKPPFYYNNGGDITCHYRESGNPPLPPLAFLANLVLILSSLFHYAELACRVSV